MTLRNRVMMTPMGTNLANPDGSISNEHKNYYKLRAKGGTGLIVVENVCVAFPLGSNGTSQLRLDHDSFIPHMYELTELVHSWGCKISIQVNHAGAAAMPSRIGGQCVSASDIPCKTGGFTPRALSTEEVYELVQKYADACKRAQMAGFDSVELHAGHSYLVNQFISPTTNKRTDEFGGSAENRARFLKLILQEARKRLGSSFPIAIRISADELVPGGNTLEDTLDWLPFVDEYVDLYNVSAGLNDSMEKMIDKAYLPDGWKRYMSRAVKEKTGKPVIISGNIRDPKVAEDIISSGDADIVAMGRTLIADPDWCNKVSAGREDEIRKCISCCIGCVGNRMVHNRPIRCTINPAVTEGEEYKKRRVTKPCKVVVIGAGTAGMETACTAAEIGCNVTLIDQNDHLGGRAAYICNLPEKFRMRDFVTYLTRRVERLENIKVLLNTPAEKELVAAEKPDLIVCATGSKIVTPNIPGLLGNLARGNIMTADGVIANVLDGSGKVELTGNLGDVMKESVEAARTVVRSRASRLGITYKQISETDIHVHFPEGAVPKDGPSAGSAITLGLVSALTGIPVKAEVAMTGEITLRGEVLPIGGLKEKLLAALRGGIKEVLIPEENVKDLEEVPENVKEGLVIRPVRTIDEVFQYGLSKQPEALPQTIEQPITAKQQIEVGTSATGSTARN